MDLNQMTVTEKIEHYKARRAKYLQDAAPSMLELIYEIDAWARDAKRGLVSEREALDKINYKVGGWIKTQLPILPSQ